MARRTMMVAWALLLGSIGCAEAPLAAIERLHRQDVAATAPGDVALLAETWTDDAVRIDGKHVDVGKAAIRAADERSRARHPQGRVVSYVPTIREVRIAGDWAFEWGAFTASYQESPTAQTQSVRGTVMRVLRRQRDGSWKFARVMVHAE